MFQFPKKAMCIILSFCFLSGCGQAKSAHTLPDLSFDAPSEEVTYYLDAIDISGADDALQDYLEEDAGINKLDYGLWGKSVYRIVNLFGTEKTSQGDCLQVLEAPYTTWENVIISWSDWEEDKLWYIYSVCNDIEDRILVILYDGNEFALGSWDRESGAQMLQKLPVEIGNFEFITSNHWYSDKEENIYIHSSYTPKKVICYDSSMENKREIQIEGMANRLLWDNVNKRMLYLGNKDGNYGIYTLATEDTIFELKALQSSCFGYCAASETECFLADKEAVWKINSEGELMKQAEFMSADYVPKEICGMSLDDSGLPLVLIRDEDGIGLLALREGVAKSKKQELTLAVTNLSSFWKKQVAAYNKQSKDYRVNVIENEGIDNKQLLQVQVAAGKGPDIMQVSVINADVSTYAEKGYLLDLTEPFKESMSHLPDGVIDCSKCNDRVYTVPISCWVDTMTVNKNAVDGKTGWTLDELMEIVEKSPATVFSTESGPAALIDNLVLRDVQSTRFIDYEQGVCHLDGEAFQKVLNFAKKYLNTNESDKDGQRVRSGEIFSYSTGVYGTYFINFVSGMFQGEECYIGYPSENGGSHYIYTESFVVNKSTECPEGAIDFLQYLQSEQVQNELAAGFAKDFGESFPVRTDALEKALSLATQKESPVVVSQQYLGVSFYDEGITKEQADALIQVFKTAKAVDYRNDFVYEILSQELPPFIAGERSVERTAEIIQNRVQLYLDEHH